MKNILEIVKKIDELISKYQKDVANDPILFARKNALEHVKNYLQSKGFPKSLSAKSKLSLAPLLFQEANYDGIEWTERNADLEQLTDMFEIDYLVQNFGKTRKEASQEEFEKYIQDSLNFI